MQSETRREYIKRIGSVLDFIEKHLDEDLSLERLSHEAHYSPFHFHRVFSIVVGENLNEYVNRKRIERIASILLVGTDNPVKELAYSYGFSSESSFSRSFKKYYGISPTRFKSEGKTRLSKIGIAPFTPEKHICGIDNLKNRIEVNAQINVEELQQIKLAGITQIGEFDKVSGMYQRLMEWGSKKEILPHSDFKAITIYHDNPNVTETSKVRYSTCVTTDRDIKAEGEIRPLSIQSGYFAIGHFEIEAGEFPTAWESMNLWVIENDFRFRDGEYFEVYHNDHKTHPQQKFILDICIPLERTNTVTSHMNNVTTEKGALSAGQTSPNHDQVKLDYHELIGYMKSLKAFFFKAYGSEFKLGSIYMGSKDFSYFSLTTPQLKKQKLKFVIILNHRLTSFEICLSGQNKSIRKKYWEIFQGSSWNKYHIAESIESSLSIVDQTIVANPDFSNTEFLTRQIETAAFKFINEIRSLLEE